MADISKITLPNGTTYDIKDATARSQIAGGVHFIGVSSTAITDGGTETPTISGTATTPSNGDLVIYNSKEFIWDGSNWNEFGDMSNLGSLAYKNSASGTFTPGGNVSQPTFTGTSKSVSVSGTPNGSVTISSSTTGTKNYTPAGTVSQPTFTGTQGSVSVSGTTSGTVTISKGTGTANYTPTGTVSTPTISVGTAGTTTTIKNPTSVTVAKTVATAAPSATAPSNQVTWCAVSGETLQLYKIGYTTGASISTSNVTVKTGDASYTASQPTFTGDGAELKASFTGSTITSTGNYTPAGTVSQPTFTGTGTVLSGSFSGSSSTFTGTYKPEGTVSTPTFTGTAGTVTVS